MAGRPQSSFYERLTGLGFNSLVLQLYQLRSRMLFLRFSLTCPDDSVVYQNTRGGLPPIDEPTAPSCDRMIAQFTTKQKFPKTKSSFPASWGLRQWAWSTGHGKRQKLPGHLKLSTVWIQSAVYLKFVNFSLHLGKVQIVTFLLGTKHLYRPKRNLPTLELPSSWFLNLLVVLSFCKGMPTVKGKRQGDTLQEFYQVTRATK